MTPLAIHHIYVFTALTCLMTGYIPSVSTEVILASLGLYISPEHVIPLAMLGAFAQTIAKLNLYYFASKVVVLLKFKSKRKLVKLKKKYKTKERLSTKVIFVSALTGLPPYYFINLLCGLLDTGWRSFALLGFTGMFIRFSVCLAFPGYILHWLNA